MFAHSALSLIALRFPHLFRGRRLHRMALAASHAGDQARADRLFEAAVGRYRSDLRIEALARLRTHELMTRVRAGCPPQQEADLSLEIERRLANLETIETLDPPFTRVEARSMLANWLDANEAQSPEIQRAA